MSATVFSHSVRVLACGNCGAPLHVPSAGGAVTCGYCQAELRVEPRREDAELAIASQTPAVDEAERFEKLRSQAAHPALLPQSLAHLAIGGVLLPQQVERAMAEWRQARSELAAHGQFPAAERLFHLTRLLSEQLAPADDEMRRRALLETAMELLQAPRHRQVLRGALACHAARVGDLPAADEWLAGCNPRSDDIHVDTAWRLSRSYVCTARGDWSGVLQVLGARMGDVPLASGEIEACGLLRANALERSGQVPQAAEQLCAMMGKESRGIAVLEQYIARHRELGLCPLSFPLAKQRVGAEIAQQGREQTIGRTGIGGPIAGMCIFGGIGLLAILSGLFEKSSVRWGPVGLGLFFLTFAWVCVHFGIVHSLRKRRRDLRIFESGLDATLTVLELQSGGKHAPDRLKVIVQLPGRLPYETTCLLPGGKDVLAKATPGAWLRARVDPNDPAGILPFA